MRDKVKGEIAKAIRKAVESTGNSIAYNIGEAGGDVEFTQVSELETQVKVIFRNSPPRYFLVKVSEKL